MITKTNPISSKIMLKKSTTNVKFWYELLSINAAGINKTAANMQKSPLFINLSIKQFPWQNYHYSF